MPAQDNSDYSNSAHSNSAHSTTTQSGNYSSSESATHTPHPSDRTSHASDRGIADLRSDQDSGQDSPVPSAPESNSQTRETAERASAEPTIVAHPPVQRESQGALRVALMEVPANLPLEQRPAVALQFAQEAFAQTGYWVAFYKAILGAEGVVNKLFPTVEDLDFFYMTDEFAEIQQILTALRASDTEKADAIEPLKMITIRIPRSMQGALINESKRHGTSINKLCITKLLRPIESHWVPEEKGKVKGRKPRA